MKNKEEAELDELIRLIEEEADIWLEHNGMDEFEDTEDSEHPFRFEYQHESITSTGTTRFKKWSAD